MTQAVPTGRRLVTLAVAVCGLTLALAVPAAAAPRASLPGVDDADARDAAETYVELVKASLRRRRSRRPRR